MSDIVNSYSEFRLALVRKLSQFFAPNSVIFDHQPNTGSGGSGNANSKTWIALETRPIQSTRPFSRARENGKMIFKSSYLVDAFLRFYGPESYEMALKIKASIDAFNDFFGPLVFIEIRDLLDHTSFLSARWERRASMTLTFSVCYELIDNDPKYFDRLTISGDLVKVDATLIHVDEIDITP